MSYCINPKCTHKENSDRITDCLHCGSSLLINDRYRITKPLRHNPAYPTDIYEVKDWGEGADWGTIKIMKVLKYSNNQNLVSLFQREARALMWLRNSGIPRVEPDGYFTFYPNNSPQPLHCLVMEKIEGENLEDWSLANKLTSQTEILDWLKQLIGILDLVHEQNIFHRDIKPSNIILRPNGLLALIDFGTIAVGNGGKTQVGTTGYAAPEQIEGKTLVQSDFFAVGRSFVHLVTGRSPMDFSEEPKTGKLIWRDKAPQVSKPLADLIDDLMEKSPKKRPKNTRKILLRLEAISNYQKSQKISFNSQNLSSIALVLLAIISAKLLLPNIQKLGKDFAIPNIANFLNKTGTKNYNRSNYAIAEFFYRLALTTDSDFNKARYGLGSVCERREDFDCAQKEYKLAMEDKNIRLAVRATNNLARLHIYQQQDYQTAIALASLALKKAENPAIETKVRSDLYKNLGWAHFQENRYAEAEKNLEEAIAIEEDNTPAYCLLAQVLEGQEKEAEALVQWRDCLKYPTPSQNPEVRTWKNMAQQRLK
ncbi:MAG: protein kinase [Cyanobacteriota bacterium]|nr:protein kinase [Cyanobacteriota bacterium]